MGGKGWGGGEGGIEVTSTHLLKNRCTYAVPIFGCVFFFSTDWLGVGGGLGGGGGRRGVCGGGGGGGGGHGRRKVPAEATFDSIHPQRQIFRWQSYRTFARHFFLFVQPIRFRLGKLDGRN